MPAERQTSRSSGIALAVSAITGTWLASPLSSRMTWVASSPFMTGICTSISPRS